MIIDKRILVVDDDIGRMEFFKERLKEFDVTYCLTAEEAIKLLKKKAVFDVFFLDHDLGIDMKTGYDLTKYMEKQRTYFDVVIIHTLNPIGADYMKEALRYNIPGLVVKVPFNNLIKKLPLIIEELINVL